MSEPSTRRDGFGVLGIGAAACLACCAGPILAFLGGLSLAGAVSSWFIGGTGLVVAAVAGSAYLMVLRRRRPGCDTEPAEPVAVDSPRRRVRT